MKFREFRIFENRLRIMSLSGVHYSFPASLGHNFQDSFLTRREKWLTTRSSQRHIYKLGTVHGSVNIPLFFCFPSHEPTISHWWSLSKRTGSRLFFFIDVVSENGNSCREVNVMCVLRERCRVILYLQLPLYLIKIFRRKCRSEPAVFRRGEERAM